MNKYFIETIDEDGKKYGKYFEREEDFFSMVAKIAFADHGYNYGVAFEYKKATITNADSKRILTLYQVSSGYDDLN